MYFYLLMSRHSSSRPLHRSCCCRRNSHPYTQPGRLCSLEQCFRSSTGPQLGHQQTYSSSHCRGRCSLQESCCLPCPCPHQRGEPCLGWLCPPHTGHSRQVGLGSKGKLAKFILKTRWPGGVLITTHNNR